VNGKLLKYEEDEYKQNIMVNLPTLYLESVKDN
jgi:hypothetical protein